MIGFTNSTAKGFATAGVSEKPAKAKARKGLRRAAVLVLLICAMIQILAATPATAHAFTWSGHGSYGKVGVPVARVGFATIGGGFEQIRVPQRLITESPRYAGQDQYVCIKHRTWQLDLGKWSLQSVTRNCGWILANQTQIPDAGYTSAYTPITGTFLGYDVVVTWQLRNGVQVGDLTVDYQVGNGYDRDLQCALHYTVHCSPDNVHGAIAIF
jgi:hypothetical protein